jgi:hypothetical protein
LEQLANASHAAVAKMVDVVRLADSVRNAAQVIYGRKYIVRYQMLWYQLVDPVMYSIDQFFLLILSAEFLKKVS